LLTSNFAHIGVVRIPLGSLPWCKLYRTGAEDPAQGA